MKTFFFGTLMLTFAFLLPFYFVQNTFKRENKIEMPSRGTKQGSLVKLTKNLSLNSSENKASDSKIGEDKRKSNVIYFYK